MGGAFAGRGDALEQASGPSARHFGLIGINERVKLLGGVVCIQSEPGAGTCLSVCVPWEKNESCKKVKEQAQTICILLADDHPIVREGLRAVLETQADFEVIGLPEQAAYGEEALHLA